MTNYGGISGEQLLSLVERIEKLEEEKAEIAEQIKEVVIPPLISGILSRLSQAARANFCFGVMPGVFCELCQL